MLRQAHQPTPKPLRNRAITGTLGNLAASTAINPNADCYVKAIMRIFRREKLLGFWPINIAGWTAYGLVSVAGALPYVGLAPHLNSVRAILVSRSVLSMLGILNTTLLRSFCQHQRRQQASLPRIAVWAFPLS